MKRSNARPHVSLDVSADDMKIWDKEAEKLGISRSEYIRSLLPHKGESGEASKDDALVSSPSTGKSLAQDPALMNETSSPLEPETTELAIASKSFTPRCSKCQLNNDCTRDQHGEEGRIFLQCQDFRDIHAYRVKHYPDGKNGRDYCDFLEQLDNGTGICHIGLLRKDGLYEPTPKGERITIAYCWKCYDIHEKLMAKRDEERKEKSQKSQEPEEVEPIKNKVCLLTKECMALTPTMIQHCRDTCDIFKLCFHDYLPPPTPNYAPSDFAITPPKEELLAKLSKPYHSTPNARKEASAIYQRNVGRYIDGWRQDYSKDFRKTHPQEP